MNPIFIAAAAGAAAAAAGEKTHVAQGTYGEPLKIHWFVGDDKFDKSSLQELCVDIAQNRYHLEDGQKVAVTQVESKEICPPLKHLKNALKCGAATALFAFAALTGVPMLIAGPLALLSFAAGIREGVRAAKAPDTGYEHRTIRSGEIMIQNDNQEHRKKLVYTEKSGPNKKSESDRNPTFIGWVEGDQTANLCHVFPQFAGVLLKHQ